MFLDILLIENKNYINFVENIFVYLLYIFVRKKLVKKDIFVDIRFYKL